MDYTAGSRAGQSRRKGIPRVVVFPVQIQTQAGNNIIYCYIVRFYYYCIRLVKSVGTIRFVNFQRINKEKNRSQEIIIRHINVLFRVCGYFAPVHKIGDFEAPQKS